MSCDFERVYDRLFELCKSEDFAGYDPFDGLNSKLFQQTPLRHFYYPRLVWLQLLKRSGSGVRLAARVEKGINPKAIALFALAEMSRFRVTGDEIHSVNSKLLLDKLLTLSQKHSDTPNAAAYGYNFDWQSRVFFAPKGTPAIVPTAFAHQAFSEAFSLFPDNRYQEICREICNFIFGKLNRPVSTPTEICYSYTPLDSEVIYNASLLAAECLARTGTADRNEELINDSAKAVRFVLNAQMESGAWAYGREAKQGWIDNFHTAYVLLSLHRISELIPSIRGEVNGPLRRAIEYWAARFFMEDGAPKYYDNELYPIDIHSAAVAVAGLSELSIIDRDLLPLAEKVAKWTISNLRSSEGYFYYRKTRKNTAEIPYMRWGQAWMAYALARLIEAKNSH